MEYTIVDLIKQICSENEPTYSENTSNFHPLQPVHISKYRQNVKKYMKVWITSTAICARILSEAMNVELPHFGVFSKVLNSICFTPASIFSAYKAIEGITIQKASIPKAKPLSSLIASNLHLSSTTVDDILRDIAKLTVYKAN